MSDVDEIPSHLLSLLERPLYGVLGTIRPDNTVQANPMWYEFDGKNLLFTHTSKRAKYRNLKRNPSMSLAVVDPENPLRYLEVRGELIQVEPDPSGAFYVRLAERYGMDNPAPPPDSADRVILTMDIRHHTSQ